MLTHTFTQTKEYVIGNFTQILHDSSRSSLEEGKTEILEAYFNDIYKLFLGKLAKFESSPTLDEFDKIKLRSLLEEILNVKALLVD